MIVLISSVVGYYFGNFLLGSVIGLSISHLSISADIENSIKNARSENDQMRKKIEEMKGKIEQMKNEIEQTIEKIDELEEGCRLDDDQDDDDF